MRLSVTIAAGLWCLLGAGRAPAQEPDGEFAEMLQDAQSKLLRGQLSSAEAAFEELLDAIAEEPAASRPPAAVGNAAEVGLQRIALLRGKYHEVRQVLDTAVPPLAELREFRLLHAEVRRRLGDYDGARQLLARLVELDADDLQARYELGAVLALDGRRAAAREAWQQAVARPRPADALQLAYLGRSMWRLGGRDLLEQASQVLVESMTAAPDRPEARTTYGLLKFEVYGEASGFPSGERDVNKVLEQNGDDEQALLAMYRIRSANAVLDADKTERFLQRLLERDENNVEAIVLRAANVLDDRRYGDAARVLDAALAIDPNHRVALCHRAAAAHLLHDTAGYQAFRARALAGDARWPEPDRILADHLVALYRFADALPFYEAALGADADDLPSLHGMAKALIYTGQGEQAKQLLGRAKALQPGFVQPWRNNAIAVQELLDEQYTVVDQGAFKVQMHRGDAEVLQAYLLPIQLEAAEVLGDKYHFKPERPTRIEVLHTWDDFSVRTIGFRGFTALGACFGGLITLVSPVDGDLRQQDFMWEATAWHEYTHVLTLGLSKHRVPRWLTEGFSVYEEKCRDPAWERGMDRELFDAFHNQDIPPVHLLNRLFRGPRILFGYYQGGLIVEWIASRYGFDKALALLRAFGEDLDTEQAFQQALGMPSRDFDRELLDFVAKKLRGIRLVPRFDDAAMQRLVVQAAQDRSDLPTRVQLAWACAQRDNPVDAGRWLAEVLRADPDHGGALLVRAELLHRRQEHAQAIECWRRGFAAGADDFDSRLAFGDALLAAGDVDGAIDQFQRAKACWPGCTEQQSAPELRLARLYRDRGDRTQAQMEMKAYCRRTARAFQPRYTLAEFEREAGNRGEELRYLTECNRIDPFHRELHVRLGEAALALGKQAQAALEFEVAAAVLPALDRRYLQRGATAPAADAAEELAERGGLWLRAAQLRHELGDQERALRLLDRIVKQAPASAAAAEAATRQQEWRGR